MEISCKEVVREISNYIENEVDEGLRNQITAHLKHCDHCTAVYDGMRNVIRLGCDERTFTLPAGFSHRLYRKLTSTGSAE